MNAVVAWALATGAITGAIWVGTLLVSHIRKLSREQLVLLDQLESRLEQLDTVEKRLVEVEGRLEFAERVITAGEQRAAPRLRPRADGS